MPGIFIIFLYLLPWYTAENFQEVIMGEITEINFTAFGSKLTPQAFNCFRVLFENTQNRIIKDGPQGTYQKPLAEFMNESGISEMEVLANAIREIIQCRLECKEGEVLYFFPFLASISIEGGILKYGIPEDIEKVMPRLSLPSADSLVQQ